MSVLGTKNAVVNASGSVTDPLSQFFTATGTTNPAYLVIDALDRNEYTTTANGDLGSFSANGVTVNLQDVGGDGRGVGIVYSWQAATHQYVNATLGDLNLLDFTSSDSPNDVTNISLFTTTSEQVAQSYADDAYGLMQADAAGYVGSVTFAESPTFTGAVPAAATPNGIAAAADSFVGQAWNEDGCWVLASTIAAEAGAGLPVQSTAIGVAGKANGEWTVVFNGPAGQSGNWQSMVSTGDIVAFGTPGGGGHITTCVSGCGASAMLVDNITYENARGQIVNAAQDGSPNDVLIAAPHAASQEWNGVAARNVVIYALDTPVITDKVANITVNQNGTLAFTNLFAASDPAHKAITQYQAYTGAPGDRLLLNGHAVNANAAATAVTASSLSALSFLAGATAGTDMLTIRAYNGAYWGDSQTLPITVLGTEAPTLTAQTPNQIWHQGQAVSLVLPATLFKDPQGQPVAYTATGPDGSVLPAWLHFNTGNRSFTGTAPAGMEAFTVVVTATDTAGLSANEHFSVTVPAAAPSVALKTAAQSWTENSSINLVLPSGTFADPQNEPFTYKATLASGAALPAWLHFDSTTLSFAGTAPATQQSLQIRLAATDTSNLSAYDLFTASVTAGTASGQLIAAQDWSSTASPTHAPEKDATLRAASGFHPQWDPHADLMQSLHHHAT